MKRSIYAYLAIVTTLSYFCVFGVEEGEKQPLLSKQKSPSLVRRTIQLVMPSSQTTEKIETTEKIDWDIEIPVPQRRLDELASRKKIEEGTQ